MESDLPLPHALSALLDAVPDGVLAQDLLGRVVYANTAAVRWFEYPSADALLTTVWSDVLERFDIMDDKGEPFPLSQMPGRRTLLVEETVEASLRIRTKTTGVERWLILKATPVRNDVGEI